ncbi:MAG TPA: 4Fe-4S dicluster domain-containing protein [Anaerolineaceae bacterium]|nr:4Fe-4S dicluster domain-containing protein [Anaerolineaceae bacterium]
MAHHTLKSGYKELIERLNRFPQGAPPSETLNKILQILFFSEKEAHLVSLLPIKPFTALKASQVWKMDLKETRILLDQLASRALLVDVEQGGEIIYAMPPPMAGFFEFSMMRLRGDVNQKVLGELFFQYLNVEDEFIRGLFVGGETQLGRVFVHEPALSPDNSLQVLDYERASEVIRTATHRGIGMCYCRHKMEHMGRACDAPMSICMTFNNTADSLTRHDYARLVDVSEGLDLLQQAYEHNLVQFGENVRQGVNFICNCCGCCCEAMIAARKFGILHPIHTTNFLPLIQEDQCNGCGKCVSACPVEAMTLVSMNDPHHPKLKKAKLNEDICLGCGVCARNCSRNGIKLAVRKERIITPVNSTHRVVMMAIERGMLQNLIFDNRVLWNHRALAAVFGVVLRLPPIKQALARRQVKSRYLETIITRLKV